MPDINDPVTPPAAASGSLSPSVYPPWDGNQLETRTYGGVEEGRVNETAVRPEGPGGSQDMQVGMPVQKLPGGLDGDDGGGMSVPSRIFTQE
jgi:hypothetical protein